MWVANICFEREHGLEKTYVTAGKLWHDGEHGFLRIALFPMVASGKHGMTFFGNAFDELEPPPYVQGDIVVQGNFLQDSTLRKEWKVGFIYSESNEHGKVQYIAVLYANPLPIIMTRQPIPNAQKYGSGVILNIKEQA